MNWLNANEYSNSQVDYSEDQPEYRNSETKSYIASTGFTYTEIVSHNSTLLPDDDYPSMSLASQYGEMVPRSQSVASDASKVCVNTTRYILKKHVFVSPALKEDTSIPSTTVTSIAGNIYDTACRYKTEQVVQQYLDRVPIDDETQTVTTSLVNGVDASTQYSHNDLVTDATPVRIPDTKSHETLSKKS